MLYKAAILVLCFILLTGGEAIEEEQKSRDFQGETLSQEGREISAIRDRIARLSLRLVRNPRDRRTLDTLEDLIEYKLLNTKLESGLRWKRLKEDVIESLRALKENPDDREELIRLKRALSEVMDLIDKHIGVLKRSILPLTSSERMKVAVLDLEGDMGESISDDIVVALVSDGRFNVLERSRISDLLKEKELSASGLVEESTAMEVREILGVDGLIMGSISKDGRIMVRLVSAETGAIFAAAEGIGEDAINSIVRKLRECLPIVSGKVLKTEAGEIIIDIGSEDGLKKGMKALILRRGEEIKDPKTGEGFKILNPYTIWDKVGEVSFIDVQARVSRAFVVRLEADKDVKVGDIVLTK